MAVGIKLKNTYTDTFCITNVGKHEAEITIQTCPGHLRKQVYIYAYIYAYIYIYI